ncbi:hypothetical protein ACVWY2_006061 [Bradyrhizobium sp. JR6.1]
MPFDLAILVDHQGEVGLAAAERLQLFGDRAHLRHEPGRQRDRRGIDRRHVAFIGPHRPQQILGVEHADDVLRLLAPQRDAGVFARQHLAHQFLGRQVGIDHGHLGAVDHHVGDLQFAEVQQPAEHVAVLLLDLAFVMQQIDRAAQAFGRRQDGLMRADLDAKQPHQGAGRSLQ